MLKKNFSLYIKLLFFFYFLLGLLIYKDFGVGIEEHFHRQNGFYWLIQILNLFQMDNISPFLELAKEKYQEILLSSTLPDINIFNFYGIIFDVPLAFIETFLSIDSSKIFFEIRHFAIFLIFFISSIFFYKIINKRFNDKIFVITGLIFYIGTPRIFGDSFHNNKDILFLSFLTISVYFLFSFFRNKKNKNLILFCLFSALASSSRIMGIYLPAIFLIFQLVECLSDKISLKTYLSQLIKVFFLYIFFLYIHYPYMWELNVLELISWFKNFFYWMDIKVLFNGEYYTIKYLPRSYLPVWILITSPILLIFFTIISLYILTKRAFCRLIKIEGKSSLNSDFWSSYNEKNDFFILISFLSFIFFAIFLNVAMLSGWRHFYFLHFFLCYLSTLGFYHSYLFLRKKIKPIVIYIIPLLIFLNLLYSNYTFHPYQSLYFNEFLNKDFIKKFQVDTPSISRSDALKFILSKENQLKQIKVGNSSWTPLRNGADMLDKEDKIKFIFVGHEQKLADYIYTNFIYKSDEKFNKNYIISSDFVKIRDLKINNVHIYSIYKKLK